MTVAAGDGRTHAGTKEEKNRRAECAGRARTGERDRGTAAERRDAPALAKPSPDGVSWSARRGAGGRGGDGGGLCARRAGDDAHGEWAGSGAAAGDRGGADGSGALSARAGVRSRGRERAVRGVPCGDRGGVERVLSSEGVLGSDGAESALERAFCVLQGVPRAGGQPGGGRSGGAADHGRGVRDVPCRRGPDPGCSKGEGRRQRRRAPRAHADSGVRGTGRLRGMPRVPVSGGGAQEGASPDAIDDEGACALIVF